MRKFELKSSQGLLRRGVIRTSHGEIETPAFVPVGTQASIKSLTPDELKEIGVSVFFVNAYHMWLRPGEKVVEKVGGVHRFSGWEGPIMTDSGGFQVFSLGAGMEHGVGKMSNIFLEENATVKVKRKGGEEPFRLKIGEDGVSFRSHLDGSILKLTPEKSIEIQSRLGSDILLTFDECTSPLHDERYTEVSMERTGRWAERSLAKFKLLTKRGDKKLLYGIVQGGTWSRLRKKSAEVIGSLDFDGYAIGGSLGHSKRDMWQILETTVPFLEPEKPRHLLGIGEVEDVFEIVERGVDTFDAILPTRLARMGQVFTRDRKLKSERGGRWKFRVDITNSQFRDDSKVIDNECGCYTCRRGFSRAYLCHLFRSRELLGYRLATIHNLWFYMRLVDEVREAIEEGRFRYLKRKWLGHS